MKESGGKAWERQSPDWPVPSAKSQSGDWRSRESGSSRESDSSRESGRPQSGDSRAIWSSRGYIPHCDDESLIQHVTVHLADSLPKSAIEKIEQAVSVLPESQYAVERRRRMHDWIDAGHGACVLRDDAVARMVQDTFLHFDEIRYRLHAWVVMPNHIHVLFQPIDGWALSKIVASWKKFTARQVNEILGRERATRESGAPGSPLWHREYWDRYIRNEKHYRQTVDYIHSNPVAAGLASRPEKWEWSSAAEKPGSANLPIGR